MTCPSCGAAAPADARFCPSCGHLLHAPVDERRVATVVFADLVGFTAFSEYMDPEQVKYLVDQCFDRLAADITGFGGRVDKTMGDAIIALFGAPVAHEDDAERAVRAALKMQSTIAEFATERGAGIQLRVGINTGEVLVGTVRAGGEYTAMGDVVNVASRLQTQAAPGTVVVGPATHDCTREIVRYEPLGLLLARGREEPVEAWLAVEALVPPGYRPRRGRSPLVGRSEELGLLRYTMATAVSRSRAQLVLLLGDAGVGKSRLAEELETHALTQHEAVVLEGRCVPYGEANPWWPVGEAVRQACGIEPSDDAADSLEKSLAAVAEALGVPRATAEVARIADGLLYLMGDEDRFPDVDPTRARDEARRAVQTFLEALARRQPVLLVISELHWADTLVLDLIGRLLDRLRGLPLVLVGTARPELDESWTPPVGRHNLVLVNLDPLGVDAASDLLDQLLPGGVSSDLRALLLERSGGNPFFLEELVALLGEQGAFNASGDSGRELPATLRGLLAARLDSLSARERGMLEDAAVVGRTGRAEVLLALATARGEYDAPGALELLAAKDLLLIDGDEWEFRSDLVREVAYETLTKAERARRHHRLATWLSTRLRQLGREDEELEQLAYHYGMAAELVGELGTVDGVPPDVARQALESISRAAARSDQRETPLVSLHLIDQALRILPKGEVDERRRLLLGRAQARASLRELSGARADVDAVVAEAEAAGNEADMARALTVLGDIEQKETRFADSTATLGQAIELWRDIGDRSGEADALRLRGMTAVLAGQADAAEPDFHAALEAFREVGDRKGEAWALQSLAWAAFMEGHTTEAEQRLDESARLFTEIGDIGGLGWVVGLLGWVRYQQGHLDEAEALAMQIMDESRERGDRWGLAITLLLLSFVRLWKGQTAESIPLARESRELFHQVEDPIFEGRAVAPLARALVARGQFDEAAALVEEVHAMAMRSGIADGSQYAALMTGMVMGHAGDVERMTSAARLAAENIDNVDDDVAGPERYVLIAMAHLMSGEVDEALQRFDEAMTLTSKSSRGSLLASLALARAAAGDPMGSMEAASEVSESEQTTYMDRTQAAIARGFAHLQRDEVAESEEAFDHAIDVVDGTGDRLMQAVTRLARAMAFAAAESPQAEGAMADARRRLEEMRVKAEGWETIFRLAVRRARV
ncbi:MAG TPA: adenylate/guanylate cyclase domain-containing protein [Acidimicrobiales bacterium]|nr:adenylate/guanylate cyclase domain-containing protein [Acidimicrobiales bacterium]